jgi:hypothetical protein
MDTIKRLITIVFVVLLVSTVQAQKGIGTSTPNASAKLEVAATNKGFLTLSSGSGNWWGTLVSNNIYYSPAPWISDPGTGGTASPNPGIIWYWVR